MDNRSAIKECPYCGGEEGFYVKMQIRGTGNHYYSFGGEPDKDSVSRMHDNLRYMSTGECYCRKCHKKIEPFPIIS